MLVRTRAQRIAQGQLQPTSCASATRTAAGAGCCSRTSSSPTTRASRSSCTLPPRRRDRAARGARAYAEQSFGFESRVHRRGRDRHHRLRHRAALTGCGTPTWRACSHRGRRGGRAHALGGLPRPARGLPQAATLKRAHRGLVTSGRAGDEAPGHRRQRSPSRATLAPMQDADGALIGVCAAAARHHRAASPAGGLRVVGAQLPPAHRRGARRHAGAARRPGGVRQPLAAGAARLRRQQRGDRAQPARPPASRSARAGAAPAAAGGEPGPWAGSQDYVFLARGGREVPIELRSTLITFDGRPSLLAICRDQTERLALQAQLMASDRLSSRSGSSAASTPGRCRKASRSRRPDSRLAKMAASGLFDLVADAGGERAHRRQAVGGHELGLQRQPLGLIAADGQQARPAVEGDERRAQLDGHLAAAAGQEHVVLRAGPGPGLAAEQPAPRLLGADRDAGGRAGLRPITSLLSA